MKPKCITDIIYTLALITFGFFLAEKFGAENVIKYGVVAFVILVVYFMLWKIVWLIYKHYFWGK